MSGSFHEVEMFDYPLFEFAPYDLALASKIIEVAEADSIDVMHMHYAIPHATAAYLARQMYLSRRYLPFVTTLHGTDITLVGTRQSFLPITRFSIAQSDAVTAVSRYLAEETCRAFGHCGVEVIRTASIPGPQRAIPVRSLQRPISLRLNRLNFRPVKRLATAHAFARIRKRPASGDVWRWSEKAMAESLAASYGLERSAFVGQVPNILDYLGVADAVAPKETESFGLAALEAIASEVPVIATRVGGLPEVVVDGQHGYLIDVGDIEGIADRAIELLQNEGLRREMGKNGRAWAIEQYNTERVIPQYVALYERVVNATRNQSSNPDY
jgi:N-acetyl-alpha-D-glucosaminyl L-malate synthase BshA